MDNSYPHAVVLEDVCCPVDGSDTAEFVIEAHDILYGVSGEFRVVKCTRCGLMRTSPRPTLETMSNYYPADYKPYESKILEATESKNLIKRLLKKFVNFNTNPTPNIPVGSMLEIGCAAGNYLHEMSLKGWHVEGIEPSPQAAGIARSLGFEVHTGAVETAPEKPSAYDLVVGWMVLEHLHEPVVALQKLHRWTKPKSWVVFSVPNAASLEARLFGKAWYALQLPTHTFHYTPKSIEQVLACGGWKLERVFHQRILVNLFSSAGYWLNERGWENTLTYFLINFNRRPWYVHQMLYPLAYLLSLFGQTGRMTIWAKRIDD
jgi:2-polyprenyl-3-methyl-5-hydroxy-6-metoxy-1,4-benzoquinol methylase